MGFRYFAQRRAEELGLNGWTRNLDDGRVEVYAVGPAERLSDLAAALHMGPRMAEVRGVEENGGHGSEHHEVFGTLTRRGAFHIWVVVFAVCVVAIALCVAYVDRPVAEFFDSHVRHTESWCYLGRFLAPFQLVVVAAIYCSCWPRVCLGDLRTEPGGVDSQRLCSAAWSLMWTPAAENHIQKDFWPKWARPRVRAKRPLCL